MTRKPYTTPTLTVTPFPVAGQPALWLCKWSGRRHAKPVYARVQVLRVGKRATVTRALRDGSTRTVVVELRKLFPMGWDQGHESQT